jgi:hypothetical protein
MRFPVPIAAGLAFLAAAACKPASMTPTPEPEPVRRSPSTVATLDVPPGHLPAPGMCRVWVPGKPPGHQAEARSCRNIERTAPAGSLIVERSGTDRNTVHVRVVDERRPGVVVLMRVYQIRGDKVVRAG